MTATEKATELLAMYEARLRFIDVYDALLEKIAAVMKDDEPEPVPFVFYGSFQ